MNRLTKRDARIADLFLEDLLTIENNDFLYKNSVYWFFNKNSVSNKKAEIICEKLNVYGAINLKNKEGEYRLNTNFVKDDIITFLKEGGLTDIWLRNNKLNNESITSTWKLWSFWPVFIFGLFGGVYSVRSLFKEIKVNKDTQEKQQDKLENKEITEKAYNTVLENKIDSLKSK
ncbi:hypothetical protein SAMN05444411_1491 [Lutibacter oricola]|uniref:Uncharacterized protein n=1 Tax=Lutibacter oricola TaxID=762486 RepID=A0A1H3HNC8_9FLAO|nr:hypothetical protein [Lutibacter oricola]SDY16972.1 hypothetical protein SAMN05444411_1491 [Lutibacter oricola]